MVAGDLFSKNEMQKLDIFQVVSNASSVAETGVQKKSISTWKLNLRELNAENCLKQRLMQRFPGKKNTLCWKNSGKKSEEKF